MNEFELIDELIGIGWRGRRDVIHGPGDDAPVLRGGFVVSTDMSVEGVHFRTDWITWEEVGFRAAGAALSDLAAMGAEPVSVLASLALPVDGAARVAMGIQRGIAAAGDRVSAPVVGGDLSRTDGPTVIDIVVVGRARSPVYRSGARAGDAIWISGAVGGSGAAVAAWTAGGEPTPEARRRFVTPPDRTALGLGLSAEGVSAMIDVSDGLVADAGHIGAKSGALLALEIERVPLDPAAGEDLNRALRGGEDYELLFTASEGAESALMRLEADLGIPLTRIGTVEAGQGVVLVGADGRRDVPNGGGHDHFGR